MIGGFVPFLIYFLLLRGDPSYTESVDSGRSVRSVTAENPNPVDSTPKWSSRYHVKGIISLPFAKLNETFEAWYDKDAEFSRIDYQNGKTKTYQFTNVGSFGSLYKVDHNDNSEEQNTDICTSVRGTNEIRFGPQNILPDLNNYTLKSVQYINDRKVEYWFYQSEKEHTLTSHGMWLIKKLSTNLQDNHVIVPLKYEVIVSNSKFQLNLDSYVISYSYFVQTILVPHGIFSSLKQPTCKNFHAPDLDHVFRYNPMQEFINNNRDNYYYVDPIFEEFNLRHNKIYSVDSLEYVERKKILHQNLRYIHWKNRANAGYKLAINQFADRYPKELLEVFVNEKLNDEHGENHIFNYNKNDFIKIPSDFNWVNEGAVSFIKSQSVCGSGWSYAIAGAVEGAYFLKNKVLKHFSAQALTDCVWRQLKSDCNDGGRIQGLHFIKNEGLPTEDDYDLNSSKDGICHMENTRDYQRTKITGYQNITSFDEDVLKYALLKHGPIAISIHASLKSFMFYSTGVYYDKECRNSLTELNHSALLVGYGTMKGVPYWMVKNSWSYEFGSSGYIFISRKDNNCGVLTSPTFVVL